MEYFPIYEVKGWAAAPIVCATEMWLTFGVLCKYVLGEQKCGAKRPDFFCDFLKQVLSQFCLFFKRNK